MAHTIVIIANGYQGHRDFGELLGVDADAGAVEALFRFALPEYTVVSLRNRSRERVLESVRQAADAVGPGENLIIYFAGHAVEVKGEHVLVCPEASEKNLDLLEGVIPVKLLRRETVRPGVRRKLILDCCRTMSPIRGRRGALGMTGVSRLRDVTANVAEPEATKARSPVGILLGCNEGQAAPEIPGGRGGLFTQCLVRLLDREVKAGREVAIDQQLVSELDRDMQTLAKQHGIAEAEPQLSAGGQRFVVTRQRFVNSEPRPTPPRESPGPAAPPPPPIAPAPPAPATARPPLGAAFRWVALLVLAIALVWVGMVLNATRGTGSAPKQEPSTPGKAALPDPSPPTHRASPPTVEHPTAAPSVASKDALLELTLASGVTMRFVPISSGEFLMGSPASEEGRFDDEGPQHKVRITKAFAMGVTEVTQAQWETVMGTNPSHFKGPTLPVESVSWFDAVEFCNRLTEWLNGNGGPYRKPYYAIDGERVTAGVGTGFRLPTEAEWEYACRAGTETPFHFGPTISTEQANYDGNYTYGSGKKGVYREKTTPVGSFPANAWGLYDMHGNVAEWCWDWYGEKEYSTRSSLSVTQDPTGPVSGVARVVRGGSWFSHPRYLRSACRKGGSPSVRNISLGFRLCLDSG